jgi:hypothetical protein
VEGIRFAPLDKSYYIRLGVLDLLTGKSDTREFLAAQANLSTDLYSVLHIDMRRTESATLFRFMTFAAWKFGRKDLFMGKVETLGHREICNDPSIVNLSQEDLLKLDNGTSQWASAAAICGDPRRIDSVPPKLRLTYDVIDDWRKGLREPHRQDATTLAQMKAYTHFIETGQRVFAPAHSEDYCFARAFGLIDPNEAELRWPSLKGHESNRIKEMEKAIRQVKTGKIVFSDDHRVVQALAMRYPINVKFSNPGCVSKSWPRFWEFFDSCFE